MEENDGLEKFREHYPTYIELLDIVEDYKRNANKLCDDIYLVLQKNRCKEKVYEDVGVLIDNFKKINENFTMPVNKF